MTYIRASLRREVVERANHCCEYCLVHEEDRFFSYEIDHIIAEKHGGATTLNNLCWSCYLCNGYKGSDIGSIDWNGTGELTPLFHPRKDNWVDHFQLSTSTGIVESLTSVGRVTVFLLRLNIDEHVRSRQLLMKVGRYPCLH